VQQAAEEEEEKKKKKKKRRRKKEEETVFSERKWTEEKRGRGWPWGGARMAVIGRVSGWVPFRSCSVQPGLYGKEPEGSGMCQRAQGCGMRRFFLVFSFSLPPCF